MQVNGSKKKNGSGTHQRHQRHQRRPEENEASAAPTCVGVDMLARLLLMATCDIIDGALFIPPETPVWKQPMLLIELIPTFHKQRLLSTNQIKTNKPTRDHQSMAICNGLDGAGRGPRAVGPMANGFSLSLSLSLSFAHG